MRIILILLVFVVAESCVTTNEAGRDQPSDTAILNTENDIKVTQSQVDSTEYILNFIAEFVEKDFKRAHKELVDQGKEYNYQFTEMKYLGDMIKYSFEIPDVEGYQEYTCIPSQGESTTLVSGDHDVAKLYFDQTELLKTWDRNERTSNGRVLEHKEKWEGYPISTHMLVTYLIYENESILTIKRTLIPD